LTRSIAARIALRNAGSFCSAAGRTSRRWPGPFERPVGVGHDQRDDVGPLVAADHRLGDLALQRQHALELLRGDVVALVVDDDVLLAVGDHDPAALVEVADVAGVQPAVDHGLRGLLVVAPVAEHDQLAAHEDLAVRRRSGPRRP
jgi:hypothetical protein